MHMLPVRECVEQLSCSASSAHEDHDCQRSSELPAPDQLLIRQPLDPCAMAEEANPLQLNMQHGIELRSW